MNAITATTPKPTIIDKLAACKALALNQPGGNVTGVTQTNVEVSPKQLEFKTL